MNLEPIGYVRKRDGQFQLEFNDGYRDGLQEVSGFSHLQLLSWGHLADTKAYRSQTLLDTPYKGAPDKIGVFATRSPARPNPILLSIAQVSFVDIEQGVIGLYWVDVEPDTPLLDIKPYHPCSDRVTDCSVPAWCEDWPQSYEESSAYDWSQVFNY